MMATSEKHFRYFALPAEIRNHIMEYILVPGDIYIRPAQRARRAQQPWKSPSPQPKRFVNAISTLFRHSPSQPQRRVTDTTEFSLNGQFAIQQSGFQLLATCKQAYNEGHYMFYAMNTFHWPPGPVNNTDGWYADLQPEHRSMIKTIFIDLNLFDLPYGGIEAVEKSASRRRGGRPDNQDGNAWGYEVMRLYCCSTPQNLREFVGLERVIVQCPYGRSVMLPDPGIENEWACLKEYTTTVSHHFEAIIQLKVSGRGWRKTKMWLEWASTRRTESRA